MDNSTSLLDTYLAPSDASSGQASLLDAYLPANSNAANANNADNNQPLVSVTTNPNYATESRNALQGIINGMISTKDKAGILGGKLANSLGLTSDADMNAYNQHFAPEANILDQQSKLTTQGAAGSFAGSMIATAPLTMMGGSLVSTVGDSIANAGMAAGLPVATDAVGKGVNALGGIIGTGARAVTNAATGAVEGGTANALQSATNGQSPAQNFAAGAPIGAAFGVGVPVAIGAGKYIGSVAKSVAQPFTDAGRAAIARGIIADAGNGASMAGDTMPYVSGSNPTLAEATANPGVATLQRNMADIDPNTFSEIASGNEAARNAHVADLATTIGDHADAADAQANTAQQGLSAAIQQIGSPPDARTVGNLIRQKLTSQRDSLEAARSANAEEAYSAARSASNDDSSSIPGQVSGILSDLDQKIAVTPKGPILNALKQARSSFTMDDGSPIATGEQLETARKSLNGLASVAGRSGDNTAQAIYMDTQNNIENLPQFGDARRKFAADSAPLDAYSNSKTVGNQIPGIVARDNYGNAAPSISDPNIPDALLKGKNASDALNSYFAAHADPETAAAPLRSYLMGKVASAIQKDGSVDVDALESTLKPYQTAINERFPEVDRAAQNLSTAQQAVEAAKQKAVALRSAQGDAINLSGDGVTQKAIDKFQKTHAAALLSVGDPAETSLANLQTDLARSKNIDLGKSRGSPTSQNDVVKSIVNTALPGKAGQVAHVIAPLASSIVGLGLGHATGGALGSIEGGLAALGAQQTIGRGFNALTQGSNNKVRNALVQYLTDPAAYQADVRQAAQKTPNKLATLVKPYVLPSAVSGNAVLAAPARNNSR